MVVFQMEKMLMPLVRLVFPSSFFNLVDMDAECQGEKMLIRCFPDGFCRSLFFMELVHRRVSMVSVSED